MLQTNYYLPLKQCRAFQIVLKDVNFAKNENFRFIAGVALTL